MSIRVQHKPQGDPCSKCGLSFQSHKPRISSESNRTRKTRRDIQKHNFIAIDGEGVTRKNGIHDYVLLACGNEKLCHWDSKGSLSWQEIFSFLYDCFLENPNARYVGYFLSYDFSQWIKGLPEDRAESLLTEHGKARRARKASGKNHKPFPVNVGSKENPYEWEIDMLGMRRFQLRPGTGKKPDKEGKKNPHKWMYICDAGPFFQQSFLKTLEDFPEVSTEEERLVIRKGKERRSIATKLDEKMIAYNQMECELLGRIMPLMQDGFADMGIELGKDQWFGPGQAAQAWLRLICAPTREEVLSTVPLWALIAAESTYFGGWFEAFMHGHVPGPTYEFDVNSAYPDQIRNLPCLLHGKWSRGKTTNWKQFTKQTSGSTFIAIHGMAEGSDPVVGAMLHRKKNGTILRPQKTCGWFWLHEIEASMRAGLIDTFELSPDNTGYSWMNYRGCKCSPPIEAMRELYQKRLDVGKKSAKGKAYKLVYNSGYGKFAQTVGNPKFSNPVYASLITAGCRIRILDAIATHPTKTRDLIKIATDGVYFRTPHSRLEVNKDALGKWDTSTKQNLTVFMPGLYWSDSTRENLSKGKEADIKSRGVPGRAMAKKVLEADKQFSVFNGKDWPKVEIPIEFTMITPKQALARHKWHLCGNVSQSTRTIVATPFNKREKVFKDKDVWRSMPYHHWIWDNGVNSTPYDEHFGEDLKQQILESEFMTPEGDAETLMVESLNE